MKRHVLLFQSSIDKSWRDKFEGVSIFARSVGWQLHVIGADTPPQTVRQWIRQWDPIGCLVERGMSMGKNPVALFGGIPTVYLDQNLATATSDASIVSNDSAAFARLAAKELLKSECPNFTYIPTSDPTAWSISRGKAFESAVRRARRNFVTWSGSLEALPRPCGILCAEDAVAREWMDKANMYGISIPGELMFVGIDNDPLICENTNPPLTSVQPDFKYAGYMLAEMLAKRLADPQAPPQRLKYGPSAIVVRASSSRSRAYDIRLGKALAYITEHAFDTRLTSATVVKAMGCSRRLADLIFNTHLGHSILWEIQNRRFEKACSLLLSGRTAISDIPLLCGYETGNFFMKLFKRKSGMTMRKWRKANSIRVGHVKNPR